MFRFQESQTENIRQQEVPQLNRTTGISNDYINEYAALMGYFSLGGINEVRRMLTETNLDMQKYEERFPPTIYKHVVNEKNRDTIRRIDELADSLNEKARNPETLKEEDFLQICNELERLIRGTH